MALLVIFCSGAFYQKIKKLVKIKRLAIFPFYGTQYAKISVGAAYLTVLQNR